MYFPEALYLAGASKKDRSGPAVLPYYQRSVSTAASAAIQLAFAIVPASKVLVLGAIGGVATAGAAQTPDNISIYATDTKGNNYFFHGQNGNTATASSTWLGWSGEVWLPAGWTFVVAGNFNAGVANNSVTAGAFGSILPESWFVQRG